MHGIKRKVSNPVLQIDQRIITCPGRKRLDEGRAGYAGVYADADSIPIRLGLIRLGDIAFTAVNGEVFNPIATRLKKESPFANTLMVTLTNGYTRSAIFPTMPLLAPTPSKWFRRDSNRVLPKMRLSMACST